MTDTNTDTNVVSVPPMLLEQLAIGVHGYTVDKGDDGLYIPLIQADYPGEGDVGRYLDTLPRDRTVKVPCVVSDRLMAMLLRRSFVASQEWSDAHGEHVEVMVRRPVSAEVATELDTIRRYWRTCQLEYHRSRAYVQQLEREHAAQRDVVEAAADVMRLRAPKKIAAARGRLRERLRDLAILEARRDGR